MGSVVKGAWAPNLFTLYPNCKHSTGDTSLPGTGAKISDKSLPSFEDTFSFCHKQPIRERERGERVPVKASHKMLPLQILCEPRGPEE